LRNSNISLTFALDLEGAIYQKHDKDNEYINRQECGMIFAIIR